MQEEQQKALLSRFYERGEPSLKTASWDVDFRITCRIGVSLTHLPHGSNENARSDSNQSYPIKSVASSTMSTDALWWLQATFYMSSRPPVPLFVHC